MNKTLSGTTVTMTMEMYIDPCTPIIQVGKTLHNANSYYSTFSYCSFLVETKSFFSETVHSEV